LTIGLSFVNLLLIFIINKNMENIIALKELRINMEKYATAVKAGKSFIVLKQNKPLFKISPIDSGDAWEEAANFTKVKKGGVDLDALLAAL